MAVYTPVSAEQLTSFLEHYDLGTLESYEGIAQGVSNTNYRLQTSKGLYILTLFEPRRVREDHIPFFLAYANHLADAGIPSAYAIKNRAGKAAGVLAERTTAIMSFMEGAHPQEITAALCHAAGALAGRMHKAGETFDKKTGNSYGPECWHKWIRRMAENLGEISFGLYEALRWEWDFLEYNWPFGLPAGAIHADLFPDNVFFKDGAVSGVIDFHFACTDFFAYDLAIMINAWCFDDHDQFVEARYDAMLEGYVSERPLSSAEERSMPVLLRGAAVRFLLSRCDEVLSYRAGDFVEPHDPVAFVKRLEYFQGE